MIKYKGLVVLYLLFSYLFMLGVVLVEYDRNPGDRGYQVAVWLSAPISFPAYLGVAYHKDRIEGVNL